MNLFKTNAYAWCLIGNSKSDLYGIHLIFLIKEIIFCFGSLKIESTWVHVFISFSIVFPSLSLSLYRIYSLFLPFFVLPAIEAYELRKEQNHKNQNVIWQTHMDYAVKQLNDWTVARISRSWSVTLFAVDLWIYHLSNVNLNT